MSSVDPAPNSGLEVSSSFVRYRNALLAQADLGSIFVDYYLHLADHSLRPEPEHDRIFKEALGAFVLHCASRPRNELIAWTLNFQTPLLNLFLVADNEEGTVAGRVFTENVKQGDHNLFFSETVRANRPLRRSAVDFQGSDSFRAVEAYYAQSEQRPARYFQINGEEFAMLSAHPDYDREWFERIDAEGVRRLGEAETVSPLEKRHYRWHCGCNQQRILKVLSGPMKEDPEGLFGAEEAIRVECPRCAARYAVTREAMEAFLAQDRAQ
jgi:molecular chaperone Hsp33